LQPSIDEFGRESQERVVGLCAVGAGAIALVVLGAAALGEEAGRSLWLEVAPMTTPGAVLVLLLAAGLWLRRRSGGGLWSWVFAGAAALLGVSEVFVGMGEELVRSRLLPGESLLGAVAVTALAGALIGLEHRSARGGRPTQAFAVVAAMVCVLGSLVHLYDPSPGRQADHTGLAPPTALALAWLSLGVLLARRGPGALLVLTSAGPGGVLARRLLPWVVLVPPGLDLLRLLAERRGWLGEAPGQALQTTLIVTMLGGLAWRAAARVDESEEGRRAAEEAAIEGERRAREIVESLPHLVWTSTAEGACDYLSPQWVAYTGLPEEGQLGYLWWECLHPEDRPGAVARWGEATGAGRPFDLEFRIRRHDGVYRWFKTRAEPLRDVEGRIRKWFGTNTDVDDQRRAEAALREAHGELEARVRSRTWEYELLASRLQAALELASLGVWEWVPATRVLSWDPALRRLYGVGAGEPVSYETWEALLVGEDRARVWREEGAAFERQGEQPVFFRIRRRDGQERLIESLAVVRRDARGRVERVLGVNRDVTEERAAAERLRVSESLLRDFVEHAPAAIAMFDTRLCYVRASRSWRAQFGLEGRELAGLGPAEGLRPPPACCFAAVPRVLGGEVERAEEEAVVGVDGSVEWWQWEARPWRRADGEVAGVLLSAQSITARKRLELDLQRQRMELERSNRDLEQFAYVASHDLQEPLRAVAGCVQLLQRRHGGALPGEAQELITHAVDGARRMQALILDLLTFSRVGTGELARRPTGLGEALEEALQNLRAVLAEAGAEVAREGELPTLEVDRARVVMLLQNLVGNAVKYRHPERACRVQVGAVREGEEWVVSVRDNGIGIEGRFHERIFVIFQRLHTRSEYPGTGIGLALCKKIVERHGGRIWVESALGVGSVFRFTLSPPASS
jgi:PAS domain S-box-containing protein